MSRQIESKDLIWFLEMNSANNYVSELKVYPSPAEPWLMVKEYWAIISEACIFHTESISQTQSESPPLFTKT